MTTLLRKSEYLYYSSKLTKNHNNIKNTWAIINKVINTNKKEINSLHNPTSIEFNDYFSSIGPTLAKQIINEPSNESIYSIMNENTKESLFLLPTTLTEIQKEISNTKIKYSTDFNDINMYIIKNISTEICPIITHLFNRSLSDGYFPNILKKSKVIPLYKSGDRKKPENYRPISLLPQLSKILERLIKNRILNFINKHNIINDCQYGFRNNISTADAISETVDIISDKLESLQKCAIISIDLRKAFDTLDHTILLNKLFIYGIRGTAFTLIKSYLSEREQYVSQNGQNSNYNNITCGVPQGSVLGPLLFILYINDLPKISNNFKPILFADDTNLIFYDKTILILKDKMQTDINKLFKWLNINKLSININKTNVLLFNIRNKNENINLNLYINNIKLKQVTDIQFLGVYIDDKLNWKKQINYVATKLCRAIAILNKVKHKFDIKTLILLYNYFFYSHLN